MAIQGLHKYSSNEGMNIDMGQLGFDLITLDFKTHIAGPEPYWVGTQDSGAHVGATHATILSDPSAVWVENSLVGYLVSNTTDSPSKGTITANTATTITATLAGGSNDEWQEDDVYLITHPVEIYHPNITQWVTIKNITTPQSSIEEIFNYDNGNTVGNTGNETFNYDIYVIEDPGDVKVALTTFIGDDIPDLYMIGDSSIYGNFKSIKVAASHVGGAVVERVIAYRG